MEKPDIKGLGLELLEENAKVIITKIVRPYAEYYVSNSENKIDDIILPFVAMLEAELLKFAEQINKADNV